MSVQAIIVDKPGHATVGEVAIPKLRDDYIMIKVKAVAVNPTDWKHVDFVADVGAKIGCDYAGIVEEVGGAVTNGLKKGDRVAGFVHGGNQVNHDDGSFSEIITARGDIQIKIPDNISFEEAATLGVSITTVGQGLYQALQLSLPTKPITKKEFLLIYGGSTSTGSFAIQFAKLSGYTVITTSSPHNFDYLKSLGADAVFDYKSPTVTQDIKAYTNDSLTLAFDCIGENATPSIVLPALSSTKQSVAWAILPLNPEEVTKLNSKVEIKFTLAYTVVGEAFKFGPPEFPANPADFEFGKTFWALTRDLLAEGKIKVHRPVVNKYAKGFEGILAGMQALREFKVSGEKLVYTF
jgi:NADPH:quinone reductase-like Zn-dependent oxidoreductase